ncbi:Gx transporter family protein [Candidatus Latescibacterota bacterium]
MMSERKSTQRLVLLSMLSACGLVFFVFESFLPLLPWFRPGLGNVATLIALMIFGFGDAVKVTVLRVVLGALILGRLITPVFLFAFSGGIASVVIMAVVLRYAKNVFGPVGISVLGAVAHNIVQLLIAYLFFIKRIEIFIFTPVFLGTGVVTGSIVGIVALMVFDKTKNRLGFDPVWQGNG